MDLDEWEFIPADGFLNFREDAEKSIYFTNSKSVFNMNYFDESLPNSKKARENSRLVPVTIPIQLKPTPEPESVVKAGALEADQDSVSQVFFKKETEFVDMKMDSPKSPTSAMGFVAQIDASAFSFDDKAEAVKAEKDLAMEERESGDDGLNIWKLSLTGIGAICSFGIAAATICVLFFGSHQRNKHRLHNNHKIRFQIYDDDKVKY